MNRREMMMGGGALAVGAGAVALGFSRTGSMAEYDAAVAAQRAALATHPGLTDLVRYATLAASGHNTQPWRFQLAPGSLSILPDFSRRTPAVDPDDHHLFVSLGCAAENLALAAAATGHRGETRFAPANNGSVTFAFGTGPAERSPLFEAIPGRQSTRSDYDGRPVPAADLRALANAARVPAVDMMLVTERPRMAQVLDLALAGNRTQMADPAFLRELKQWLRFSPRHALSSGDGLFSPASGNPVAPPWLGGLMFDVAFRLSAENDKIARQVRSSSGIAVFVSQRADKDHWVRAGCACQRFALQATALGLKYAFVNQPVEVAALRPELAALTGLPGRRPDLMVRFGYCPAMPFSLRRPAATVLSQKIAPPDDLRAETV